MSAVYEELGVSSPLKASMYEAAFLIVSGFSRKWPIPQLHALHNRSRSLPVVWLWSIRSFVNFPQIAQPLLRRERISLISSTGAWYCFASNASRFASRHRLLRSLIFSAFATRYFRACSLCRLYDRRLDARNLSPLIALHARAFTRWIALFRSYHSLVLARIVSLLANLYALCPAAIFSLFFSRHSLRRLLTRTLFNFCRNALRPFTFWYRARSRSRMASPFRSLFSLSFMFLCFLRISILSIEEILPFLRLLNK